MAKSAHAAQLLQELLPFTRISLQSLSCCYWQVPVSPPQVAPTASFGQQGSYCWQAHGTMLTARVAATAVCLREEDRPCRQAAVLPHRQ